MMRTMAAWLSAAVTLGASAQAPAPSAESLAAQLQKRYNTIPGFTARFTQEDRAELLPQVEKSTGTVKVLKPSRMWWTYDKPAKHWIVDGRYMWDYDVPNKVVFRYDLPKPDAASTPLLFLAGRGDLTKDFLVSLNPIQPAGEWHLDLRPKGPDAGFDVVTLMVTHGTLKLVGMTIADPNSTKKIRFTDLNESPRLRPEDFKFEPPRDVLLEVR